MTTTTEQEKTRLTLAQRVIFALVTGVLAGLFFGDMIVWLKVVGDVFIKLLQITVVPYISLALITGLGSLNYDLVKRLALRGSVVLVCIWSITLVLVFLVPMAFPDWPSGSFFSISLTKPAPTTDFIRLFIPSNPFFAYSNAIVPAVVVFSILLGLALIATPQRQAVLDPLIALRDALMKVTGGISKLAPYGVFALIAATVGKFDIQDLVRLQVYIVLYGLTAVVMTFWILPSLIVVFTPLGYWDVMRTLRTPLITAFAVGSTMVVLPLIIDACRELIEKSRGLSEAAREDADTSIGVMIPTFYPPPSAGSVLALLFLFYSGWYVGSPVSSSSYSTLVMAGVPMLFGGTFLTINTMLELLRLPNDMFQVFAAVDAITSRFGTLTGTMHYATVGLIGTFAMVKTPRVRWKKLLQLLLGSLALLVLLLFAIRLAYGSFTVAADTKASALRNLTLSGPVVPVIDYEESLLKGGTPDGPASFEAILDRGILRVCYQPDAYPSAFYNTSESPQLVGFDIDMANHMASRRELTLTFLPTRNEQEAVAALNSGSCDILMRVLPVSAGRTQLFSLTTPVYKSTLGLVVRDFRRDEFSSWKKIRDQGEQLKLAVDSSAESQGMARSIVPKATLYPIGELGKELAILESEKLDVDAIADYAEEGAAHTLFHPQYTVVIPEPVVSVPVAYAVARGNDELLMAVNAWLVTEQAKGKIDALYDYWMLGGGVEQSAPPPWSIIRNVLGWVD
ncbi:MAG: cation:dicarboxylase symporter family transporter [Halieaceae bacterium]